MRISARVESRPGRHTATVETAGSVRTVSIPPKASGSGSSVSGGELLFLALATCYCNDVYREAAKRGLVVASVEVDVEGEFGAEGEPAKTITYAVRVASDASDADIRDLLRHTDTVAEIQNTVRTATPVTLTSIDVVQP